VFVQLDQSRLIVGHKVIMELFDRQCFSNFLAYK